MPSQRDWETALEAVAAGATLVTGNARLARRALGEEATRAAACGRPVWRRGDVLPWSAWLKRLHTDALVRGALDADEPAVLLSSAQAEALWRRVIEEDPAGETLLAPAPAARRAREAHELCRAYRIDRARLAAADCGEDASAFLRWFAEVERRCARGGWLLPSALPDHAAPWLRRDPALRPSALYLAGFEELTPQQRALFEELEALRVPVHEIAPPPAAAGNAVRVGCADPEGELRAAACWARERLQADPRARIGIVVRDLSERRDALTRHLDAELDPVACVAPGRRRRPWNLSLGRAFSDEPLVHDALLLLEAGGGRLEFTAASRLLRSPFVAGAERERGERLRAELRLRERREPVVSTRRLARLVRGRDGAACRAFAALLEDLLGAAAESAQRRSAGRWAAHFAELLKRAGWPGERGLDSHEYQALGAWQDLLSELTSLGTVLPALSRSAALSRLRRLAAERLFQPAGEPAPVQVLGLLEALGQRFDALWIAGLHDEAWPQTPGPNPFLPFSLQRELALPHATAARELAFAERLTAHLLAAAPDVVVSWPRRSEDRSLRASPLVVALPERHAPTLPPPLRRVVLGAARFEHWEETRGPGVLPTDAVGGGTALLQNQSLCPFRAFAVHRLHAAPLDSPVAGPDPMQRGLLVHRILERLWGRLGGRRELAELDEAGRVELVREVVRSETGPATRSRPDVYTPRFLEIENQRLESLLLEWLDQELARPDFRVLERERPVSIVIDLLRLRGRIDRIDELPDGSRLLIDYKSGRSQPADWLGERPREPQLPLYALQYREHELAGAVVAQLRSRQCRWQGVVREADLVPGAQLAGHWRAAGDAQWPELRAQWQQTAQALATDFLDGRAEVDPLPQVCGRCHLSALCRVDEQRGGGARDAAPEEPHG